MNNLSEYVNQRFGGLLKPGSHEPNGNACGLEALSQFKGIEWTDNPEKVQCFDIRAINDAPWSSNNQRTNSMLPLLEVIDESLNWSNYKKQIFIEYLFIETIRQVFTELPGLKKKIRKYCRNVETFNDAHNVVCFPYNVINNFFDSNCAIFDLASRIGNKIPNAPNNNDFNSITRDLAQIVNSAANSAINNEDAASDAANNILIHACTAWTQCAHAVSNHN